MLFNYLKYDLKRNRKSILYFFIIYSITLFSGLTYFKENTEQNDILNALFIFSMIGLIIYIIIFSINNYSKELNEARGYFTFSIPINGYKLFIAKLLLVVILFYSYNIISIIIVYFIHPEIINSIKNLLKLPLNFLFLKFLIANGLLMYTISSIYFSLTLINRFIKNKFSPLLNIILITFLITQENHFIKNFLLSSSHKVFWESSIVNLLTIFTIIAFMITISGILLDKYLELN